MESWCFAHRHSKHIVLFGSILDVDELHWHWFELRYLDRYPLRRYKTWCGKKEIKWSELVCQFSLSIYFVNEDVILQSDCFNGRWHCALNAAGTFSVILQSNQDPIRIWIPAAFLFALASVQTTHVGWFLRVAGPSWPLEHPIPLYVLWTPMLLCVAMHSSPKLWWAHAIQMFFKHELTIDDSKFLF